MKRRRFSGELAKPIIIRTQRVTLLTNTPAHRDEVNKHNSDEWRRAATEQLNKLALLNKEFELPDSKDHLLNFAMLTLALAREFVPGFHVKDLSTERGKGRHKEWNVLKYSELIADVETLKNENRRSDSEACRILSKTKRFESRWGNYDKRTLENRLIMARDKRENVLMVLANNPNLINKIGRERFKAILIDVFGLTKNAK